MIAHKPLFVATIPTYINIFLCATIYMHGGTVEVGVWELPCKDRVFSHKPG